MLFDGDDAVRTLDWDELESLAGKGEIDFPRISQKEIHDKSKGDMLSKGVVIIQTGWFLLQCIARRVEHLPITEIEIVTLAFATLNFATYALWWHKPLNVQYPFRVLRKQHQDEGEVRGPSPSPSEEGGDDKNGRAMFNLGVADAMAFLHGLANTIERAVDYVRINGWSTISNGVAAAFEYGIQAPLVLFMRMVIQPRMRSGHKRVPMFYSGNIDQSLPDSVITLSAAVIAMIFGAIHCAAWSSQFPSHTEQLCWRIASLFTTFLPLFSWWGIPFVLFSRRLVLRKVELRLTARAAAFISIGCSVLYVLFRTALLVVAFMSLRSLPPGAHETIHWTTLIPHI